MQTEKKPIYPIEPWSITETAFDVSANYRNETTFALSNGYIGTRGTFEEGYDFSVDEGLEGNFINGFYESEPIRYGEWNFGFPETSQSLLNLPNLKTTRLFVGDEEFDMGTGQVADYRRVLHMRDGIVTRSLTWTSPKGKQIRIETTRLVSFAHKNIMAQRFAATPLNFEGEIRLLSVLDADVENHTRKTNPLVDYGPFGRKLIPDSLWARDHRLFYQGHTENSGLVMACGSRHSIGGNPSAAYQTDALHGGVAYTVQATKDRPATLDKLMAYSSSLDVPADALEALIETTLSEAAAIGFDGLLAGQREAMRTFWESADVTIDGDDAVQQGIRFNLFHIMQAAGRDGKTGMGAKGLSGEGYEGHYFWDTEIYVLPVFAHTFPDIAKRLLDYRYSTLGEARQRARVLGHPKGALYPWRTINGREASTYVPLGTAQYHINADVAFAFQQYVEVTGDTEYLKERAAEVLCETARVWADVGCFAEGRDGKYCICCVTGPDEYTAFVDNNFYTNLMARENLRDAVSAVHWLREHDPDAYRALAERIGLEVEEPALWQRIVENMYFPYDEAVQVYLQDDGFLLRKPWDDAHIPPEKKHLLYENYHPLYIWRQRMAKQADTILAMHLHSDHFDEESMRRHYDFYQQVTLHHSSLSTCIFGIVASGIGYHEDAYRYFGESARMDLDDYHDNFYAGIHAANMAGTWQAIVHGFAGVRTNGSRLEIAPSLPERWKGYSFRLRYRGAMLEIRVSSSGREVRLLNNTPVALRLMGEEHGLLKEGDMAVETLSGDIF